jgi:hypothetical protein
MKRSLFLAYCFLLTITACTTKKPENSDSIARKDSSQADSIKSHQGNGYVDNSITLHDTDTLTCQGYTFYFTKSNKVEMPFHYPDDNEREKIVSNFRNSHEKAIAVEKYLQEEFKDYFTGDDSTLTLFLDNSHKKVFQKWSKVDDIGYNFEYFYKDHNYFVIFNQYGEGYGWALVNRKNGFVKYISGEPRFSPDGKKILTINLSRDESFGMNGFEFLTISGDTLIEHCRINLKGWGPANVKWMNENEVVVEGLSFGWDPAEKGEISFTHLTIE